ncbi:MAG: hypothetical protein LBB08_02665 [Rickettsiales bacterium]|jgi:hypothetical protein|nr:hypothetical protein [Rickettsiales bacterium]
MKKNPSITMIESFQPYSRAQMRYLKQNYPKYEYIFLSDKSNGNRVYLPSWMPQLLILPGGPINKKIFLSCGDEIKKYALSGGNIMAVCSANYMMTEYSITETIRGRYKLLQSGCSTKLFGGATVYLKTKNSDMPQVKYAFDRDDNKIACLYYNGPYISGMRLTKPAEYEECEPILRTKIKNNKLANNELFVMVRKKLPGGGNLVLSTCHCDHSFASELDFAGKIADGESEPEAAHKHSHTNYLSRIARLADKINKTESKMQAVRNYVYEDIFGLER